LEHDPVKIVLVIVVGAGLGALCGLLLSLAGLGNIGLYAGALCGAVGAVLVARRAR
jgi:hypothetical protein